MRSEINYKKKTVKRTETWRLNNMLLNTQRIAEEIKEETKRFLEMSENENITAQKTSRMQQEQF